MWYFLARNPHMKLPSISMNQTSLEVSKLLNFSLSKKAMACWLVIYTCTRRGQEPRLREMHAFTNRALLVTLDSMAQIKLPLE